MQPIINIKSWYKGLEEPIIHKVFVQTGESLAVIIPKSFAEKIGVEKGTYVRFTLDGKRLILEKLDGHSVAEPLLREVAVVG